MEKFSQRHIGSVLELTIDDILNSSVEDLIDQGKRFTIIKDEPEVEDTDYGE